MQSQCQEILGEVKVTVRESNKLIDTMSSTAVAVLQVVLKYCHLQSQQIQEFIQIYTNLSKEKWDSPVSLGRSYFDGMKICLCITIYL